MGFFAGLPGGSSVAGHLSSEVLNPAVPRTRVQPWVAGTLLLAVLLSLPVLTVVGSIFFPADQIWLHLFHTVLPEYVGNSLVLMAGVGLCVLVLGVAPAWLVTMYRFPWSGSLEWALLLPLAMPAYIIAYAYTGMLDVGGPFQSWLREAFDWRYGDYWFPAVRSRGGAVAMLALVLYPYVYLLSRAAFIEQSICVLEVARSLGCGPIRTFLKIGIPLARPGIIAGLSLVLMETLADYGTVQYFGVATFTTGIFRTWFGLGSSAGAAQLSALLLLFVLALLVIERVSRRQARYHHTSTRYAALRPQRLTGARAWSVTLSCAVPIVLGFLLPAGQLLAWGRRTYATNFDPAFITLVWHSLELAAIGAVAALLPALFIAYGKRLHAASLLRISAQVLALGYAVPGTVIAVGVLIPFTWLDKIIVGCLAAQFGIDTGLLLSGSIFAMIFAYLVRFLPISLNAVDAGLAKIRPSMDEAGRSMGLAAVAVLKRVHVPMMRGSLLTAALLVFVDVLKELPATLILRPFNFNTLAVHAYELANEERLAEAAVPALAIVLAGILPVILLSRSIGTARPGHAERT